MEQVEPKEVTEEPAASGNMGVVVGVPGKIVENVGLLDLRGVGTEALQQVEAVRNVGAVLLSPDQKAALTHAKVENVGAMVEVGDDYRVLVEPFQEFSRQTVEAMPTGLKMFLVGIVLFRPDVPPALIAEKFEDLRIVGIMLSSGGVQGALMGRSQITGVSATLPDKEMPVIHNIGQNKINTGYLRYVSDESMYINIGHTIFETEVPEELVAQKVASYINVGHTVAPQNLLDLLKARCPQNLGQFALPEPAAE